MVRAPKAGDVCPPPLGKWAEGDVHPLCVDLLVPESEPFGRGDSPHEKLATSPTWRAYTAAHVTTKKVRAHDQWCRYRPRHSRSVPVAQVRGAARCAVDWSMARTCSHMRGVTTRPRSCRSSSIVNAERVLRATDPPRRRPPSTRSRASITSSWTASPTPRRVLRAEVRFSCATCVRPDGE